MCWPVTRTACGPCARCRRVWSRAGSWDKTVRLWDTGTGACLRTLAGHGSSVYSVCALSAGVLASASGDDTVRVWDAATGACLQVLVGHEDSVNSVCALSAGVVVSGADDKTVRLWMVDGDAH